VIRWRGFKVVKATAEPLVRTPISNQRFAPVNGALPKSSTTENSPLLTEVAALVAGPATVMPAVTESHTTKRRSNDPFALLVPELSRPWYVKAVL